MACANLGRAQPQDMSAVGTWMTAASVSVSMRPMMVDVTRIPDPADCKTCGLLYVYSIYLSSLSKLKVRAERARGATSPSPTCQCTVTVYSAVR